VGPLRVWRDAKLVTTIADAAGDALWWPSATELAGTNDGQPVIWTVADGVAHKQDASLEGGWRAHGAQVDVVARPADNAVDHARLTVVRNRALTTIALPDPKLDRIYQLSIDANGTRVALSRGHDRDAGSEVTEVDLPSGHVESYAYPTAALVVGNGFVVLAKPDGEIDVRDRDGAVRTLGHHANVTELALSGDVVAAGSIDGTITLWSISRGSLGTLTGHTAMIRALAFAPDGHHLASTASDGTRVWDLSP
jgi:WD40 repeat protein